MVPRTVAKFGMQTGAVCVQDTAGSYFDRSNLCEENEHLIKLLNVNELAVKKLDKCHIPHIVPIANSFSVRCTTCLWVQAKPETQHAV